MTFIAPTPRPPYYAVILTSVRTEGDNGYADAAARMPAIARERPGFLGYEAERLDGAGISVSYRASLDAIRAWRQHPAHREVQSRADDGYADSRIRISRLERDY